MTIAPGVSFLAQTQVQSSRLNELRLTLDGLNRQIATGKKNETMSGFGLNTQRVLQLRADRDRINAFNFNIDTTIIRMNLMDDSLTGTLDSVQQMVDGLFLRPVGAQNDVQSINVQAQNLLEYVYDLTNVNIDGRYLFAGTDSQNPPIANTNTATTNFQLQVDGWLNGTITTAQMLSNVDSFISTDLGFSATLAGAAPPSVRISKNTELTYGELADQTGTQNVIRALAFLSQIKQPNPAIDSPTNAEYEQVMSYILDTASTSIGEIRSAQVKLSGRQQLVSNIHDGHQVDLNIYSGIIDEMENTPMEEAVVALQSMQTRLQASYEATRVISQLTLVNFL